MFAAGFPVVDDQSRIDWDQVHGQCETVFDKLNVADTTGAGLVAIRDEYESTVVEKNTLYKVPVDLAALLSYESIKDQIIAMMMCVARLENFFQIPDV